MLSLVVGIRLFKFDSVECQAFLQQAIVFMQATVRTMNVPLDRFVSTVLLFLCFAVVVGGCCHIV